MTIDFDVNEAIRLRHSVRTYNSKRHLADDTWRRIMEFASKIDNPFGTDGIRIGFTRKSALSGQKLGTYGVTRGAVNFVGLGLSSDNIEVYLAGGYQFESLVLYATSLGLGTVWLGGTLTRSAFSSAFGFRGDITLPVISPVGYPAPRRLMERAMRAIAKSDARKPWDNLFFQDRIGRPLPEQDAAPYASALANVRLAPSSLNSQPWRIIKVGEHFHFYAEFSDSISTLERRFKYIEIGIAVCHFNLTLLQSGISGLVCVRDPGIGVPSGYHYAASWHRFA